MIKDASFIKYDGSFIVVDVSFINTEARFKKMEKSYNFLDCNSLVILELGFCEFDSADLFVLWGCGSEDCF